MLSRAGGYAVRALLYMAQQPRAVGAAEIASEVGAPPNYLGKVLQRLGQAGIVKSIRGRGGGFAIRPPLDQVTVAQIISPLEDLTRHQNCVLGRDRCDDSEPCPLHEAWKQMRDPFYRQIETMTLATMISDVPTNGIPSPRRVAPSLISNDWLD